MTELYHPDRSGHVTSHFNDGSHRNQPDDVNRARQAAEALFAPKQQAKEPAASVPNAATDQATRKPRILSAVPAKPIAAEQVSSPRKDVSRNKPEKIPAAHFSRIRTWLKYGMNISQVAKLYRVPIAEIESILKKT